MSQAIRLARRGLLTTDPNPRVGCVLVRDGKKVGEGFHRKAGEPHAERMALADAGEKARGATAYVTLEPCCHHGKTPPCTDGLLEAGVGRVVAAMRDPNPLVAGKGFALLQEQGVAVRSGVLEAQAAALNPGFIKRMSLGLPYVRCKLAASLDGRTAMASGESQWITGAAARREVQLLRARSSAVVTGVGTVLADDPSLNVRLQRSDIPVLREGESPLQPLRVIVDSHLRTPPEAKLIGLPGKVLIAHVDSDAERERALAGAGAELIRLAGRDGRVDLTALMRALAEREVNEVLIEAGPTLAGQALLAGLVDQLIIYLAPHLMGASARGLFELPGLERMEERVALEIDEIRHVGEDFRVTARPLPR